MGAGPTEVQSHIALLERMIENSIASPDTICL